MLASRERVLIFYGAAGLVGVVVLYALITNAGAAGRAVGRAVPDAAAGAVIGIGEGFGLPDTTDAVTVAQGRAALDRGDYFEASRKLPAIEFLNGVGSRLGGWLYDVTHPEVK